MNPLTVISLAIICLSASFAFAQDEPDDAYVVEAAKDNTNTRLFTNDANTNNAIASGLLGIGIGVGGVLLTQAFLDAEKEKKRCQPYYQRYKRDDGVMGRLFGLGGSSNNYPPKPCPPPYPAQRPPYHQPPQPHYPQPQPPYHPPPQPHYPQPQPPYQPPRPQYPQHQYAPSYPSSSNHYDPYQNNNGYKQPEPVYQPTPVYQPAPVHHQHRPVHHSSGYAPTFHGRSALPVEAEEVKESGKSTAALLGATEATSSGAIRFSD